MGARRLADGACEEEQWARPGERGGKEEEERQPPCSTLVACTIGTRPTVNHVVAKMV